MRIRLLCFAALRELAGFDERELEVPPSIATVADLRPFLERALPGLGGRLASVRIARNETFAADHDRLADGDDIALIPPVAGG